MTWAQVPPNESERMQLLERLKVLDTPRAERFDRLVRLASRLLDVPISAISLVASDRQWFKASEGLDVRETPRDVSFCAHTMLQSSALVVEDARQDERFRDNPLVTGDFALRFYAGQPLRIDGLPLGAFCVIDRQPRRLNDEQIALLADLRDLAERELQLDDINELRNQVEEARSAQAQLRHEMSQFFSLPVELLCIATYDGRFRRVSSAWSATLGWTEDELQSRKLGELVHPDDRARARVEGARLARGGRSAAFEVRFLARDGAYRWLSWNAIASPVDRLIYATARDVSELKRMESLKNEFVSTVSHELRTPLTSICGSLDLIAEGVTGEISFETASLLDLARRNGRRLGRLINDILDIEKIEAGKLEFEVGRYPIVERVWQALQETATYARERSVGVELARSIDDVGLEVEVDPDRLGQVLANLISNAVKFEPEGGEVEVAVDRIGERIRVSVTDHGPGIPEAFQHRLFEKFAQADASDHRERGGTGLGLSISRAIVERMGGAIDFETSPGAGTTFFFELPCFVTDGERREMPAESPA